jgi:hypothetical protein
MAAQSFVAFLFELRVTAKLHARPALGFRPRRTRGYQVVGPMLNMRPEFLVDFDIQPCALKEGVGE